MTTFTTSRDIPAPAAQVFAAMANPQRLVRWWGPAGFTNTSHVCEFQPGGRWSFTMVGPDGSQYPNECVFAEIEAPHRLVIQHVCAPLFSLTISLASSATGTTVGWEQVFESADVAQQVAHIVVPANEQNLDRLAAEVLRQPAGV